MFTTLGRAIQLWIRSLQWIGPLVLTVWLPAHLLVGWSYYFGLENVTEWDVWRMTVAIEGVCSPIYAGAIVFVFSKRMQGQRTSYTEALGVGFRWWGRLLVARLASGVLILIGYLALVIPGVVFSVRLALIDPAVVLENQNAETARARSWQLTSGRSWQLLAALVLVYLLYLVLATLVYGPLALLQETFEFDLMAHFAIELAADCLVDVIYTLDLAVLFLFFWEAAGYDQQSTTAAPAVGDGGPVYEVAADEESNPYRPPSVTG